MLISQVSHKYGIVSARRRRCIRHIPAIQRIPSGSTIYSWSLEIMGIQACVQSGLVFLFFMSFRLFQRGLTKLQSETRSLMVHCFYLEAVWLHGTFPAQKPNGKQCQLRPVHWVSAQMVGVNKASSLSTSLNIFSSMLRKKQIPFWYLLVERVFFLCGFSTDWKMSVSVYGIYHQRYLLHEKFLLQWPAVSTSLSYEMSFILGKKPETIYEQSNVQ